jgi:cleavage and polyadenylation specificity factor subunit 3
MLKAQFGESFKVDDDKRGAVVKIGKNEATINYFDLTVECSSNVLKGRIENVLNRATELVAPLAQSIKL